MPSLPQNQFDEEIDFRETRGLIFVPETLAETKVRLANRLTNRNRTPTATTMNYHRKTLIKIFVILTLFLLLLISQYGSYFGKSSLNKLLYSENQTIVNLSADTGRISPENLQLNLPHCQIPKVPLYSHYYNPSDIKFNSCERELKFSTLEKGVLQLEGLGLRSSCCVSEILRPYMLSTDQFETGECIPFNASNTMEVTGKEFIKVACTQFGKSTAKFNFHASIIPSAHYLKDKVKYWKQKEEMPVNVLVLVLDSTSRTDAFRQLPNTMDYLLNELNFVDFKGFHHLGEPTMLNVIPLLLGVPSSKFFGEMKLKWADTWDNSPFIWKEFSESNFATAYIEDVPDVGTFNYGGQTGFTYKPTDFYLRPFFAANVINMGKRRNIMAARKGCVTKTPMEKFILDYQFEMLKEMNGLVPVFSMPWLCWPQHDFFDTLYKLENTTLNFFQSIKNTPGLLENTVVIVMADHGFYSGQYAESHEGLLERRLPLFLIRLPSKLISKYPEFPDIVEKNSNRITSHYDVYKTLLHLAKLYTPITASVLKKNVQDVEREFGQSLFEIIPKTRTCSEAGIPENNCACNLPSPPSSWSADVPSIMQLNEHGFYINK